MTLLTSEMKEQVENAVAALLQLAQKKQKKNLSSTIDSEILNLQLAFKKIPSVTNKIIRVPMPHTLVKDSSDICLFVKDLQGKSQERDYEPTERHYSDLLASKGLKQSIKVMPLKCLKLEYKPYEAKKNLSNMYDFFLSDDNIVRLLPGLLGKHFIARKKYPKQVDLGATDLKKEIKRVLSTELCVISGRGPSCQVSVGHTALKPKQIVENVLQAVNKLGESIPGGEINIRSLHLKTVSSPSIPVYISLGKNTDVSMPKVERVTEELEEEEVTTVRGALVRIDKKGRIELVKQERDIKNEEIEQDSDESEEVPSPKKVKKEPKSGKKRKFTEDDQSSVTKTGDENAKSNKKSRKSTTKTSKLSTKKSSVEKTATKKRKIVK